MIHLRTMAWGTRRREKHAIPPEVVAAIRRGNKDTDVIFAAQLGYSAGSIKAIRLGQRHGPTLPTFP